MRKYFDKFGKKFYSFKSSAIPSYLENENIKRYFGFWGWVLDKLYSLSKFVFRFYSLEELRELQKLCESMDRYNCDFRIYEMKPIIAHGIQCNIWNKEEK